MNTFAAVMTGHGAGAISTIHVFGEKAETIIRKIFKPVSKKQILAKSSICLGTITEANQDIDSVIVGWEGENNFAIHCHGNALIVEMIMRLLEKNGVTLVSAEQLLSKITEIQKNVSTIELEAKLTMAKVKTLQASKLIANQIEKGLAGVINEWLEKKESVDEIKAEAKQILKLSTTVKLIINGCRVVLAGPPNTGKSTLLNCLSGREKSIVTDIEGTTRDYVTANCQIGPLMLNLIDTAGLDEVLAAKSGSVDKAAQGKAVELLGKADLILMVLDVSQPENQIDKKVIEKISDKKILTVLNKSDLPAKFDISKLPNILKNTVSISAKSGRGLETLKDSVLELLGMADFDLQQAVAFTPRQEQLLRRLCNAETTQQTQSVITELLNGRVFV